MPKIRTFFLPLVSEQQGAGVENPRTGAQEITYDGNSLIVEMNREPE